jgi:hypothetical protein
MDIDALLSEDELVSIVQPYFTGLEDSTIESLGSMMSRGVWAGPGPTDMIEVAKAMAVWPAFKHHMYALICTDDEQYRDIRSKIANVGGRSQMVIVSSISAGVGTKMG